MKPSYDINKILKKSKLMKKTDYMGFQGAPSGSSMWEHKGFIYIVKPGGGIRAITGDVKPKEYRWDYKQKKWERIL
jgi:hypothetical protein